MSDKEWMRSVTVCEVHGDSAWYVCYETKTHRLRLTHRGTWSMDDMDIYWKSQAEAFAALHVAPCPLEDPYKRIAELNAEIARLRSVCREAVSKLDDDVYPLLERGGAARCLLAKVTCSLADAGKEPSDGV